MIHGIVRRLTDFGAFVDIGGVDGLIHVTDLSWSHVKHPSEIVKPDQEVDVKILSLDPRARAHSAGSEADAAQAVGLGSRKVSRRRGSHGQGCPHHHLWRVCGAGARH